MMRTIITNICFMILTIMTINAYMKVRTIDPYNVMMLSMIGSGVIGLCAVNFPDMSGDGKVEHL